MAFRWTATTVAVDFLSSTLSVPLFDSLSSFWVCFFILKYLMGLFVFVIISPLSPCDSPTSCQVLNWVRRGPFTIEQEGDFMLNSFYYQKLSLAEAPVCSISQKSEFLSDWWTTHPKWPAVHEVANCSMLQSVQGIFCAQHLHFKCAVKWTNLV